MKISGSERVALPLDLVWQRLNDPAVIQRCTPGLVELREAETDQFDAVLELALPAISGRFTGSVAFLERTAPGRLRLRLRGKGPPGFVEGEARLDLHAPEAESTEIRYEADVQIGGQIARLGQRMLSGVTREMAGQFFESFERDGRGAEEGAADAGPAAARHPLRAFFQLAWRTLLNLLGLSRRS